jgi:Domain of unknown function (DUF4105)
MINLLFKSPKLSMKKLFILLLFLTFKINAQSIALSSEAEFGLLNISPGSTHDAVYQIWGHTVLHLRDPKNGINECYDYGTFNFNQPNFIGKFLQGTLPYNMTIVDFDLLVNHYQQKENRSASERFLNLNAGQKQELYDFLINNYKPENREYKYRFFYYNCASRIRDILVQICGDSLVFNDKINADKSYRQWIHEYAKDKLPWTDFGMSLAIGLPSDEVTKADGAMFLPLNLAIGFEQAKIMQNGRFQAFVKETKQITFATAPYLSTSIFTPLNVLIGILLVVIGFTYYQFKKESRSLLFDKVLFGMLGLMGWFIIGLWFFTDHGVTEKNMNVIWAMPLFLPLIFFMKTKIFKPFLLVFVVINVLLILTWSIIPQGIPVAVIPIILAALVRIFYLLKLRKTS